MPATLSSMQTRVARILMDAANLSWSTDDLSEAIRRAMSVYALACPLKKVTTLTLTSTSREIDIASLSDLITVDEVWLPYDSTSPEKPRVQSFRFWKDLNMLYITSYLPQAGDVVRIFYSAEHSLDGLDGASGTTFPDRHASIIATGAAGFCAHSRALDLTEQVAVDREAAERLMTWARRTLLDFEDQLKRIATTHHSPFVEIPVLDRFDGAWA